MAAKLTRLTHKIAIQLVAESCTIYSSRFRRSVRKLLDTSSYFTSCTVVCFSAPYYIGLHRDKLRKTTTKLITDCRLPADTRTWYLLNASHRRNHVTSGSVTMIFVVSSYRNYQTYLPYASYISQQLNQEGDWLLLGRPGFHSWQGPIFFSSTPRPNRLCVTPSLLTNKTGQRVRLVLHSPPPNSEVKNAGNFISILPYVFKECYLATL